MWRNSTNTLSYLESVQLLKQFKSVCVFCKISISIDRIIHICFQRRDYSCVKNTIRNFNNVWVSALFTSTNPKDGSAVSKVRYGTYFVVRRFSVTREKRLLASSCVSVRMYQFCSHWSDFRDVWFWRLLLKCVEKIKICLKSDKKITHFTWSSKYVFLLPVKINGDKNAFVEWKGLKLKGWPRKHKYYEKFLSQQQY